MRPPKDEGPTAATVSPSGVEGLSERVERYGEARKRALDVRNSTPEPGYDPRARRAWEALGRCGSYLAFRHWLDFDEVRLHAAEFCKYHLLCPLCAIRRGAKAVEAYLTRYEAIRAQKPLLRPFLVTLTVKDGPDLWERFSHLRRGLQRLNKRRGNRFNRWSAWHGIAGAVWSYEVKRGKNSGEWHPHAHAVVLAEVEPDQVRLSAEWHQLTGDSFVVDVRPIADDVASGFVEVFKYAVKFSEMEPRDTWHAWETLRGEHLVQSCGVFRGVDIPDSLLDAPLSGPWIGYLYAFVQGKGYGLAGITEGRSERSLPAPVGPRPGRPIDWSDYWRRLRAQREGVSTGPPG